MRDYRFRIWNPADCTMTYNVGLDRISEYADETLVKMLQTGLKDKRGNNIYEGDVVYFANTKVPRWIKFHNGSFTLFQGESRRLTLGELWPTEDIEVIGNIYDTPELLKQENGEEVKV